jgi:hypothetical protein
MKRLPFVLVLLLACPGAARAEDSQWEITIWGRSYHRSQAVLRGDSEPLAALTASVTIMF